MQDLTVEQLDRLISQLKKRQAYRLALIQEHQTHINAGEYRPPVRVQGPSPKMDIKSFWTKNIKDIIYYIWDDAPICFCCRSRSIFELRDEYSKYNLCLDCGKEIIQQTGFPVDKIIFEF